MRVTNTSWFQSGNTYHEVCTSYKQSGTKTRGDFVANCMAFPECKSSEWVS